MKRYHVSRTINASPATLWRLLTDGANYPSWNPAVIKVDGRIAAGETIKVVAKVSPNRTFPVKVSAFSPERSMAWSGGMPLGLFKGVRTFTLTPRGSSATEFSMEEVYSGLLAPLIGRSVPDLSESFEQYATGLKARAEAGG